MPGRTVRPVPVRPGNRTLIGAGAAGLAGLAGVIALAPAAHAAPSATPSSTTTDAGATTTAPANKKAAAVVEADYGFKKIRVGVQQKQGSYVPPSSSTVGTGITISQVGGLVGTTPFVTKCVTAADTRIDSDAESASFCDFGPVGILSRVRSSLSPRQLRAITAPVDEVNTPGQQAYLIAPGATVTITQTSVKAGYVVDPASPLTLEPCQNPVPDDRVSRAAAAAPPTCDSEQEIFEDGGLPPLAGADHATTEQGVAVPIAIESDDTPKAPVTGVDIAADPKHGTARLFSTEAPDPAPSSTDASTSPSTDASTSPSTDGTTSPSTDGTTSDIPSLPTLTLDALAQRAAPGTRRLAAVSSYRAVYTPAAGFTGVDTFDYTITTANGTATARVTVTVTGSAASASVSASGATSGASSGTAPLADTGTQSGDLLGYAAALLAAGGGALAIGRQRRRGRHAR